MLSKYGIILEAEKERVKRKFPSSRRDLYSPLIVAFSVTTHKCQPVYAVLLSQGVTVMHGLVLETPFLHQSLYRYMSMEDGYPCVFQCDSFVANNKAGKKIRLVNLYSLQD